MGQKSKLLRVFFFLPPEHHIFNPADQSVDKSPCRPTAGEYVIAGKNILENSCPAAPGTKAETAKTREESALPKKGREKLTSLLADLLGFPSADRQPEAKTHRLNLYESMSPAFGKELSLAPAVSLQDTQRDKKAVNYENCLKCLGEHCHPPPRVVPARTYRSSSGSSLQALPTGPHLERIQEHEGAAGEEPRGSHRGDGQCRYEEMNGQTVTSEGKRPLTGFLFT